MKWIEVTLYNGTKHSVNTDLVRYISNYGARTRIYFTDTQYITCIDTYEDVMRMAMEG